MRGAAERQKPDTERYREFTDARLPATELVTFSKAPIYSELEVELLTLGLTKMREELGADHPYVKKVLGKESPRQLATRVVQGTKLYDVAQRRALWSGGPAAVAASEDPMIALVRRLDPDMRAARKAYEDQVESVVQKNGELIAKARFQLEGTSNYPDATFTARLSYGSVRGWTRTTDGEVAPFTDFAGAFERATGEAPFDLPRLVAQGEGPAHPDHAVRLRDHQRHHRRQLRLAGGQPERGDRRPGVRREPALAGRRLRVRHPEQPHGRGGQPRADRGAAGGVRGGPAGPGAVQAPAPRTTGPR